MKPSHNAVVTCQWHPLKLWLAVESPCINDIGKCAFSIGYIHLQLVGFSHYHVSFPGEKNGETKKNLPLPTISDPPVSSKGTKQHGRTQTTRRSTCRAAKKSTALWHSTCLAKACIGAFLKLTQSYLMTSWRDCNQRIKNDQKDGNKNNKFQCTTSQTKKQISHHIVSHHLYFF